MARSDLITELVSSGLAGRDVLFRKTVEALIAEERAKKHTVVARKLDELLQTHSGPPNGRVNGHATKSVGVADRNTSVQEIIPETRLDDLILESETRETIDQWVSEHQRVDLLRSYGLEPRNRCLLVGPPGNGKTSLAEAIAEAIMVPLINVRYDQLVTSYLGETAGRLRKVFEHAATRKCVLFFDEFETLGKERGDRNETGEIKRIVSSLLMQFDGLCSHVILIAATNHPELLDKATWRRFQLRIELPQPTDRQLEFWFDHYQRRTGHTLGLSSKTLVKKVQPANFAEAEEFAAAVMRRYVLGQPQLTKDKAVRAEISAWKRRVAPSSSD